MELICKPIGHGLTKCSQVADHVPWWTAFVIVAVILIGATLFSVALNKFVNWGVRSGF